VYRLVTFPIVDRWERNVKEKVDQIILSHLENNCLQGHCLLIE
jgi:hypothetical protein